MGQLFVNKLHTLHFVFTWILAIIVAVNWCYSFKLALPQYSESILPWSIYTLFVTLLMPGVRMVLLRMEKQEGWSKTGQICQDLLIKMTGPVVGTSWAGLVALVFPYFSDWKSPGPTGISLALAVTTGFILLQTAMERAMRDMSQQECRAVCFDILLNSLWSSLGYFWNSVWNRFLKKIRRHSKPRRLQRGPPHRFQTIQDQMNGRPEHLGTDGPGLRPLLIKALITLCACALLLWFIPDAGEPDGRRGWHRRRFWIAVKMMCIIIPSYAVTDCGFYFGTNFVTDHTGSEPLGLLAAFAYAVIITWLVVLYGRSVGWKPQGRFADRLLMLGAYLVCYAWWYPWQELLYQIQGYGLWDMTSNSSMDTWLQVIQVVVTLAGAMCFTLLLGGSMALSTRLFLGTPEEDQLLQEAREKDTELNRFASRLGLRDQVPSVQELSHTIQAEPGD